MIGRLTGKLVDCSPGQALLDVAGVGYSLQIPLSTFYAIGSGCSSAAVTLHVHTHVREEALQLFGFASPEERTSFELLIGISGVGPRLALAILSGIGVDELRTAVFDGDRARLEGIPGIGRKTAERLMLELRDKYGREDVRAAAAGTKARPSDLRVDAVSALVNLGYPAERARRAVGAALERQGQAATLENLLKGALAGLAR